MKKLGRRGFLKAAGALAATAATMGSLAPTAAAKSPARPAKPGLKPKRLKRGDTVAIVAPSGVLWEKTNLPLATESLAAMGLKSKVFPHAMDRYGYLAGTDENRAADLMAAFRDPGIDAIFCLRGGWGAARILPYLDFEVIRANPKILLGYSDITALHAALAAKTGLVTYHGPNAGSSWYTFEAEMLQALMFDGEKVEYRTVPRNDGTLVARANRTHTITPGKAEGRLVGGNLTVFTSLMGSPYFPDLNGCILCLEDVGEKIYRVDRMITQLALGGHLKGLKGIVLGGFTDCGPDEAEPFGGFTLIEVFEQHFAKLGIPVFAGAQFGHIKENFTLPLGARAMIDADAGIIRLVEPAVA
ncbi:S66 peptidase family protein [Gimibacter soli]|uniref:LD-carboxypeptidase n=1 Tax=Gimibacter soli TaxID=3024400 RepID=A0AAF0BIC9_9PROT|nr:LD-carboxypeptidase [Gimibacter soli]WCL55243.1 LD-carboxypeptidase [Gimibacter soli]